MTLLKYNGNLVSTGTNMLKYVSITPILANGGWKHKDTGVWTEFAEFWPDYWNEEGVISFDGYRVDDPNAVGNIAHNISELIIREGCHEIGNIGLNPHPVTEELMYEDLSVMDFPSTTTQIGVVGGGMFFNLANVLVIKVRALVPPVLNLGAMQSPNAKIYVPDGVVDTYKSHSNTSAYAALIFPLSDIE